MTTQNLGFFIVLAAKPLYNATTTYKTTYISFYPGTDTRPQRKEEEIEVINISLKKINDQIDLYSRHTDRS